MSDPTLADEAISFTDLIGKLASTGQKIEPVLHVIAEWVPIPYVAQIDAALELAAPYLERIAAAAPVVSNAINQDGRPAFDAIQAHGPELLADLKAVYAIAVNHDPARPETNITPADVSDDIAKNYGAVIFTPGITNAEQQREWDRDKPSLG